MRTKDDRGSLPEARDDIKEEVIARVPEMFMDPVEEREVRVETSQINDSKHEPGGDEVAESSGGPGTPGGCFQASVDWRASRGRNSMSVKSKLILTVESNFSGYIILREPRIIT